MKASEYRCASCEEVKKRTDHKFVEFKPQEESEIAICKKCFEEMKKLEFFYLIDYLYYSLLKSHFERVVKHIKKTKKNKGKNK